MSSEKQSEEKKPSLVTRRDFLKGIAVGAVVTGAAAAGVAAVTWPAAPPAPPAVTKTETVTRTTTAAATTVTTTAPAAAPAVGLIKLTVNGREHTLQVEPNWTLRDVLRDKLGYTSIKDMCHEYGACGSCTVIMDGRPILSCMTLAMECDGKKIETAEGIAKANHPLIEAYLTNHCMQCGYCTPGFILTAKALLDRIPKPTEEDIRDALAGNICRCGTYPMHIIAVLEAAKKL